MLIAPLKYLTIYPFLPLTLAKLFCLISSTVLVVLFFESKEFHLGSSGFVIAICDLLAILAITNSLWFTVQKFYWKKLDVILSASAFLLYFVSFAFLILTHSSHFKFGSIFFLVLLLHGYLLVGTGFCCIWAFFWTKNTVSSLLIAQWGASTVDEEIEFFAEEPS